MKRAWLTFWGVVVFLAANLGATTIDFMFRPTIEAAAQRGGVDPEEWAAPLLDFVFVVLTSEWLRSAAFFVLGATTWEIWRRYERANRSWQASYRKLEKLKAFEAACLAVDIPPLQNCSDARFRGILTHLYEGMRDGSIPHEVSAPRERRVVYSSYWGERPAPPPPKATVGLFTAIDRVGASRYLRKKGLHSEAENLDPS